MDQKYLKNLNNSKHLQFEHILQSRSNYKKILQIMEGALQDLKSWYFKQPLFTRTYLTGVFITSVIISLELVSPYTLIYTFNQTIFSLNIWRPFTAGIFMGKFSFGIIFQMYFAYMFLSKTETEVFNKQNYADFLWLICYLIVSLLIVLSLYPLFVYTVPFLMAITYIYCKRRPHEEFRLMFGFNVKSGYFPFVYLGLKVLLFQESFLPNVIGLALGHLYIYLKDILTVQNHRDYLATPQFFKRWWYRNSWQKIPNQNEPRRNVFAGQGVRLG